MHVLNLPLWMLVFKKKVILEKIEVTAIIILTGVIVGGVELVVCEVDGRTTS